ncbi:MAG: TonB-dependent receptor [Acaryochloris sp. SU_5_25]|nr:TonB-dependent receptor [Acaryochloris sp. SU_5_25]
MRVVRFSASVRLALIAALSGSLVSALTLPAAASTPPQPYPESGTQPHIPPDPGKTEAGSTVLPSTNTSPGLSEREQPATTVKDWMAQIEASLVHITGVRVAATETGLQVLLDTEKGSLAKPVTRVEGNTLIAEIANATLTEPFSQANPAVGIEQVRVTSLSGDRVQVEIVGTDGPPVAEVSSRETGLVLAVTPKTAEATEEDEVEITVTAEREEEGYNPSNSSTATKTDTPIRDIPQSIQVVPRQVLEDRGVQTELEALETVSGLVDIGSDVSPLGANVAIRGFSGTTRLRNGLRTEGVASYTFTPIGTIEQIEVLKGPASVLFGALDPGGVINYMTRQPLAEPYYKIEFEAGNYGFYQPSIDLSGPLTKDGNVLYRLIAAYQGGGDYKDSTTVQEQVISIAPSITFKLGDRTDLNIYYEYGRYDANPTFEPLLINGSLIPKNVSTDYFSSEANENHRAGYTLNHKFNDSWQIRHNFSATFSNQSGRFIGYGDFLEDRFLTDFLAYSFDAPFDRYFAGIDLIGKFKTGSISHQLVAGLDFDRQVNYRADYEESVDLPPLDIFNPNYDVPLPEIPSGPFNSLDINQSYGVYLQDQISFTDNLKILIGGRYDWLSNESGPIEGDRIAQNDGAFSPRIGLVYQPTKTISLYASYSQSFRPSIGRNPTFRCLERGFRN